MGNNLEKASNNSTSTIENDRKIIKKFVESKDKSNLTTEIVNDMKKMVERLKNTGQNSELVSAFEQAYQNIDDKYKSEKADIISNTTQETESSFEESLLNNVNIQIDNIKKVLNGDQDVDTIELDSIDFTALNKLLRQLFKNNLQGINNDILEKRGELIALLGSMTQIYKDRLKFNSSDFKPHEKFDKFIEDMKIIVNDLIGGEINKFAEVIKNKPLSEMLYLYKKTENDQEKQTLIVGNIIQKNVLDKGYHLAYSNSGKVFIETNDLKKASKPGNDIEKIENEISQIDLKTHILKDIMNSNSFDIKKSGEDYPKLINKIFLNNSLTDENGGELVYQDILTQPQTVKNSLNKEIKGLETKLKNPSIKNKENILITLNELKFVLDFILNKDSYPPEIMKQANAISIIEKAGYNVNTVEGLDTLADAFKKGNGVKTVFGDIMSSSGGMTGLALIGLAIFGLFKGGKMRTGALWGLAIAIFGPAVEEIAHKYGLTDGLTGLSKKGNKTGKGGSLNEKPRYFDGVKVKIKGLDSKYQNKYESMYRNNFNNPNGINEQDFAQIFAQLGGNKDIKKLNIAKLKQQLDIPGTSAKSILGANNLPNKFNSGILDCEGEKEIINRPISDNSVKEFLKLLVAEKDTNDKTIGDLFVGEQEEIKDYVAGETNFNKKLGNIMSSLTLGTKIKQDLVSITGETSKLFSITNVGAKIDNKIRKTQINGLITELQKLKTGYADTSLESKVIDDVIALYNGLNKKITQEIKVENTINKIDSDGDLKLFRIDDKLKMATNFVIGGLSTAVGILGYDPDFVPNKFQRVDIDKVNTLITKASDTIGTLDLNNIELIKKLNDKIAQLKLIKLSMLNKLSTDALTQNEKTKAKVESQELFGTIINENSEKYIEDLDNMVLSMEALSVNKNDFVSYIKILSENFANIKTLKEIVLVNNLDESGLKVKTKAEILLKQYDKFKENLKKEKDNILDKISKLSDRTNRLTSLEEIIGAQEELNILKKIFIIDDVFVGSVNYISDNILNNIGFDIDKKQDYNNLLEILEKHISNLDTNSTYSLTSNDVKEKYDKLEKKLKDKKIELEGNFKIKINLPSDVTDSKEIGRFIDEVKKTREIVNGFDNKEIQINKINEQISICINNLISHLNNLSNKPEDILIDKIIYDKINKEIGNGGNEKFDSVYSNKEELVKEEIYNNRMDTETFSQLKDNEQLVINNFKNKFEGKYDLLDQFLDTIQPDMKLKDLNMLISTFITFTNVSSLGKKDLGNQFNEKAEKRFLLELHNDSKKMPRNLKNIMKETLKGDLLIIKGKIVQGFNWIGDEFSN